VIDYKLGNVIYPNDAGNSPRIPSAGQTVILDYPNLCGKFRVLNIAGPRVRRRRIWFVVELESIFGPAASSKK
jgi:hypothetical protein